MVLDTNVWLDWLVFNDASVVALKAAHAAQQIEIVRDLPGELELERVLEYKALGHDSLDAKQLGTLCRPIAG